MSRVDAPSYVIFGAGTGSRLGAGLPKLLVPIKGRPLFEYQLDQLRDQPGSVYVVCGFQAATVRRAVEQYVRQTPGFKPHMNFIFNEQFAASQVTSIARALETISIDRPAYFIDGDLLFQRASVDALGPCPRTTVVVRRDVSADAVLAVTDRDRLIRFERGGGSGLEWANLVKYVPRDLSCLAVLATESTALHQFELINLLAQQGADVGYEVAEVAEIDRREDLEAAAAFVDRLA